MREIKFRAWDKVLKRTIPVACLYFDEKSCFVGVFTGEETGGEWTVVRKEHLELMQYTELKDKNGVEIYEGDILKVYEVTEYRELEYESPVEYIESGFLVTQPNETQVPLACFYDLEVTYPLFEIEVIGNIYEHPHLLENK